MYVYIKISITSETGNVIIKEYRILQRLSAAILSYNK